MTDTIDLATPAFAHRLGTLLVATRHRQRRSLRSLSRASDGRFSRADLLSLEQGTIELDDDTLGAVAELYGCDLSTITPARLPIVIDGGVIRTAGVEESFVPRSDAALLDAYLRLVRTLRGQRRGPVVVLRTDDIEVLAEHLHTDRETVAGWLLARMNAAPVKRTALAGMLATGVVVVGLVGTAAAVDDGPSGPVMPSNSTAITVVVADPSDDPRDGDWFVAPVEAEVSVGDAPMPVSDASGTAAIVPADAMVAIDEPPMLDGEMSTGDEAPPVPSWVDTSSDDAPPMLDGEMSTGDEAPPVP